MRFLNDNDLSALVCHMNRQIVGLASRSVNGERVTLIAKLHVAVPDDDTVEDTDVPVTPSTERGTITYHTHRHLGGVLLEETDGTPSLTQAIREFNEWI